MCVCLNPFKHRHAAAAPLRAGGGGILGLQSCISAEFIPGGEASRSSAQKGEK